MLLPCLWRPGCSYQLAPWRFGGAQSSRLGYGGLLDEVEYIQKNLAIWQTSAAKVATARLTPLTRLRLLLGSPGNDEIVTRIITMRLFKDLIRYPAPFFKKFFCIRHQKGVDCLSAWRNRLRRGLFITRFAILLRSKFTGPFFKERHWVVC